ncbi:hypothetical protein CAI21_01785 [Alkalilimnicola ehrlichii]|uniref:Thioesterase domain-containing protein n=1 Tax=Alkalilimnicola ehrlichii TaxID=351052 RepID=A0A3E0X158_9GAMM|nr:PaaI family thioesterase [Alkalilimnicola ehrlichii]RFA31374.1 hypothetical protein CAI21_01785 [Alkalilimnicola ehrlichii]RFA39351.1 hypothetical protein CAL65_00615 [Alkalilimnicola ehrlichii]
MNEERDPHTGEVIWGLQRTLGFRVAEWEENRAVIEMPITDGHLNRSGIVHGGMITTLLDTALGHAGIYCPYPGRVRKCITLSLTTSFTGQASGGILRAVGVRRAGGRRVYAASGEVLDGEGNIIAIGEGTFRLRSGSETLEGEPE